MTFRPNNLGHFYVKVRKSNREKYEPDSLTAIQKSLNRHLTQDLHRPYSIIWDRLFQSSREKLKAARKSLKKVGRGNKPHAAEALETANIESLWSNGLLGNTTPVALIHSMWLMLTLHFSLRGRDEHYKLTFGDLEVKETTDGKKYVQFRHQNSYWRNWSEHKSVSTKDVEHATKYRSMPSSAL